MHPLEGGLFRRKYRRDRRPGMPVESRLAFYPRYAWEIASKHIRAYGLYWQYRRILKHVLSDSAVHSDIAMQPVQDSEFDKLEMYTATPASKCAVDKLRRRKRITAQSEA